MYGVGSPVWSHRSAKTGRKHSVREVLSGPTKTVHSFGELVRLMAEVSYNNPEHALFYRGQAKEYFKSTSDGARVPSLYPTIYRSTGKPLTRSELARRFAVLDVHSELLLARFKDQELVGSKKLEMFPELLWAILQHYEVCPTPLLDVTHSLRVAASFALSRGGQEGFLYVFGFPHPNGSISYSVDLEIVNIRLLSICPPEAQRPYFQEGFVVGTYPLRHHQRNPSLDCGRRLIAKYRLIAADFWSAEFPAIPTAALFPQNDRVTAICESLCGVDRMDEAPSDYDGPPEGYCVKCKQRKVMNDAQPFRLKNGRGAYQGLCPDCGTKIFKIMN